MISRLVPASSAVLALVLLARCGGDDHDADHHDHNHTPHDGVVAALMDADGKAVGFVELKLHDDKGDLECWLAKDEGIAQPLALPPEQTVMVEFPDLQKSVPLAVRDTESNADEDGQANLVDGKTHYFIYPTQEDQDASWLQGADFSSKCVVRFELDGTKYHSETFTLIPHTHHEH